MGVTGLWKLIEPCGEPVPLETLENKILAVDISIWLHQVIKGFQDSKGYAVADAHLIGLFHRLCKLLYYRIKPVFVFDGKVPILKKNTIAKRTIKRNKLINEAERIQGLLLQSLAKEKVVQKALGTSAAVELLKISPLKTRVIDKDSNIDDIFKLPEGSIKEDISECGFNTSNEATDTDTPFSESTVRHHYNQNLQAIDVKSKHFRNLPADIRHEILMDIKETRKQSSWGKLHELPSKGNDFSSFQMKRLLKRRQVQECLEEVEKEMDNTRSFTLNELENIFSEEGIIEPSALPNTKHISSDANTRFLLVRDLKQSLAYAESARKESEIKPETSKSALEQISATKNCKENVDEEYDVQNAILMSLDQSAVYDESDYDYATKFKFNKEQRKQLKNANAGLARAYMIEHCGMNNDDVRDLLQQSQSLYDNFNVSHCVQIDNDMEGTKPNDISNTVISKADTTTARKKTLFEFNSSAVMSNARRNNHTNIITSVNESVECTNSSIQIIVDPSNITSKNDDLFADILFDTAQVNHSPPAKSDCDVYHNSNHEMEEVGVISSTDTDSDAEAVCDTDPKNSKREVMNPDNLKIIKREFKNNEKVNVTYPLIESKTNNKKISSVAEILNDLKKQASEVTKIELNDIKIEPDNLITEVSNRLKSKITQSDEFNMNRLSNKLEKHGSSPETKSYTPEIIEIIDDANTVENSETGVIFQFFKTDNYIKRTPEKVSGIANHIPGDKSPTKMLPKKCNDECTETKMGKVLEDKRLLDEATKTLKKNKTHQELKDMASELAREALDLEKQRNRQERMGMTLSEKINSECMQLLRLFGVPFIVAPMEAEAQCAFLDSINLTNGTITDDSDIWLFGGRTVYKNFFAQNKYVMEFKSENIERHYKVDRVKLIQLALLVGSDYTPGVNGIGPVTALEIIANFSTTKSQSKSSNQQLQTVLDTLEKFRTWWTSSTANVISENSTRRRLRNKLKNIELVEGFPCPMVVDAYIAPTVDNSQESFSWGVPDIELIKEFTKNHFGWTKLKTEEVLGPVLKKLNEKKSQSTINKYFSVKSSFSPKHITVSKRVRSAIGKMSMDYKPAKNEGETKLGVPKKSTQRKRPADCTTKQNSPIPRKCLK